MNNRSNNSVLSIAAFAVALLAFINSLLPNSPVATAASNLQQSNTAPAATTPVNQPMLDVVAAQPDLSLAGNVVASTVPQMIGYQGVLRDNEGKLITKPVTVTFRLYDNVTKPVNQRLWEEKHSNITVRDGRFSVLLGNVSNPITPTLMTSPDRFIGVQVEGYQEMQPRQKFSSVPFAMWSEKAAHANIASRLGNPDGTLVNGANVWKGLYFQQSGVSTSDNLPYARLEEAWGMRYNSPDTRWVFSSRPSVLIGYLPTGQDWGTGNLLVEGKVGIGTSNPSSDPRDKLHVVGRAQFSKGDGNTAFFIDTLSTTAAELHTEGAPVNINAKNSWLGLNTLDGSGDVHMGNGGNSLNVNGNIRLYQRLVNEEGRPAFFVSVDHDDCSSQERPYLGCPVGTEPVGSWATGPHKCDGAVEGHGYENGNIDSGWLVMCVSN